MKTRRLTQNQQFDYLIEQLEENIYNATRNENLLRELQDHCGRDREMYAFFLRASWITIQNELIK